MRKERVRKRGARVGRSEEGRGKDKRRRGVPILWTIGIIRSSTRNTMMHTTHAHQQDAVRQVKHAHL